MNDADAEQALTHVDPGPGGGVRMVDVGHKAVTARTATAESVVWIGPAAAAAVAADSIKKGNVLEVAKLAGIMAAKRADELIPLCHALPLDRVDVAAELLGERVRITATAGTAWKTGVEMEALVAASVAALTVIDMVKAVEPGCRVELTRLIEKTGGKRGTWRADDPARSDT